MRKKLLWLLPVITLVVMFMSSCKKETIINIYSNSMLWIKIDNASLENIDNFEIKFTTKDVYGATKEHHITYSKSGGFITEEKLSFPTTMKNAEWHKVHEGIDMVNSAIIVIYNGKEYATRGYALSEQRCIEVNLKSSSVGGVINTTDYDIEIIEQGVDVL